MGTRACDSRSKSENMCPRLTGVSHHLVVAAAVLKPLLLGRMFRDDAAINGRNPQRRSMAFLLFKVSCIWEFSPRSEILFCRVLNYLSFTLNLQSEVP